MTFDLALDVELGGSGSLDLIFNMEEIIAQ